MRGPCDDSSTRHTGRSCEAADAATPRTPSRRGEAEFAQAIQDRDLIPLRMAKIPSPSPSSSQTPSRWGISHCRTSAGACSTEEEFPPNCGTVKVILCRVWRLAVNPRHQYGTSLSEGVSGLPRCQPTPGSHARPVASFSYRPGFTLCSVPDCSTSAWRSCAVGLQSEAAV